MMFNWIDDASKENQEQHEVMSFEGYMNSFEESPFRECRPSYKYLIDMFEFFGTDDNNNFTLYQLEHADCPAVFGQYHTQKSIYQNLKNFYEEGINNKFILLVGPNGSAKTSLIHKIMKGAEEYSKTKEGALYTFSWVFPIENYVNGTLGLTTTKDKEKLDSFAHLDDKEISAIMTSELMDHPLLLVPAKFRRRLIEDKLKDDQNLLESVRKSYLYKGDLSKKNREIYDAMLKKYKGNHYDVLKHIRVERFLISRRYSVGAVTIEPQLHVDASMQQITMDKRLASLPPRLQSMNLFLMQGEVISANRGILEFSDLLKRPLDTFKYLLTTMETANINLNGILTELDIFFVGTSNEVHLSAFKQHPDYNSYKGRFNFIKVPYLLNHDEEKKIYIEQINGLKDKSVFEPHSLEILCLFSVMTRLRASQAGNYSNKKLSEIIMSLNPLEKTLLLSNDRILPERFDSEAKSILAHSIEIIMSEYENDNLYEGKFGISPREIKSIIYDLTNKHKHISVVEIIDYIEELISKKNEFDFLNISPQGDFHNPIRFLALLKQHAMDIFDKELRYSLGLVDDRSYEDYTMRYIANINSFIKGEKIKNFITGKYEDCDEYFITEFEKNIDLKEKPDSFRSYLIAKLGAYSLDNPGKEIVYTDVFPDVIRKLKESFRNEQKKVIHNISKNLVFYEAEFKENGEEEGKETMATPLSEKNRNLIEKILTNLKEKGHYSTIGALTLMKYLIKEKY